MTATSQRPGEVGEREARRVAEAAREREWRKPSFGKELFLGRLRLDLIHPHPAPDPEVTARAESVRFGEALELFRHAGEIALKAGDRAAAQRYLEQAAQLHAAGSQQAKETLARLSPASARR